jgi:hypothetical protein
MIACCMAVRLATDGTAELFVRGTQGERALRVDEIHHGLGLREVHFAIEEGPLGEFARVSGTRTAGEETLQHALRHEHAAVAMELDHVLAGITRR